MLWPEYCICVLYTLSVCIIETKQEENKQSSLQCSETRLLGLNLTRISEWHTYEGLWAWKMNFNKIKRKVLKRSHSPLLHCQPLIVDKITITVSSNHDTWCFVWLLTYVRVSCLQTCLCGFAKTRYFNFAGFFRTDDFDNLYSMVFASFSDVLFAVLVIRCLLSLTIAR